MSKKKRLAHIDMLDEDQETEQMEKDIMTYIVGKTKIPEKWQTAYVLMSTNVPEDLTPEDVVKVPDKAGDKKKGNSPKKVAERKIEESDGDKDSDKNEAEQKKSSIKKKGTSAKKAAKRKIEDSEDEEKENSDQREDKQPKKKVKLSKETQNTNTKSKAAPKGKTTKTKKSTMEVEEEEEEEEEDLFDDGDNEEEDWNHAMVDESESDISVSDTDDEWAPKKKKGSPKMTKIKTNTAFNKIKHDLKEKVQKKQAESPKVDEVDQLKPIKRSISLTAYLPPKLIEDPPTPAPVTAPSVSSAPRALKPLIIDSLESTGPEPEVGDFLIEKAECKGGSVQFLWRFKKGGIIQKYEKKKEKDQVFYQNILSFSDWWSCFAHKYQKVETKVLFRYKNVEKVLLMEEPVFTPETDKDSSKSEEKEIPSTNSTSMEGEQTSTEKSVENTSEKSAEQTPEKSAEKSSEDTSSMQEQEVTSTTPDNSEFQVGNFVLDKKDERNPDGFPIWKIESSILLRKFEAVVKEGKLYHKPLKTYRGYKDKDIGKFYIAIKVQKSMPLGDDWIEVLEESRPKVVVNSTTEEEFDQHPLLQHFYVYLQAFLSQALEEGFLTEIKDTEDESFTFPMGEINKIIKQKIVNIERKVRWSNKIKKALQKCPYLREVYKPDKKRTCEAVGESSDQVEQNVFLFGPEYDEITLEKSSKVNLCQEFRVGATALQHIGSYHKLCHFQFGLFEKCLAKIKLVRESKAEADVTEIMDACLGNKAWVLQNFEDFMNLVEMNPR